MINSIYFITHFEPIAVGHGGNHRSYQILNDLYKFFPEYKVHYLYLPLFSFQTQSKPLRFFRQSINGIVRLIIRLLNIFSSIFYFGNINSVEKVENYVRNFGWRILFSLEIKDFLNWIKCSDNERICLIDHLFYESIINQCKKNNIKVVIIPHNLESLDTFTILQKNYSFNLSPQPNLHQEITVMAKCDYRLMISKLEVIICKGLGVETFYYPYIPVGKIKEDMEFIRFKRDNFTENKSIVIIGSYEHQPTKDGINWFVNYLKDHLNLIPKLSNLIIAGKGTERIPELIKGIPDEIQCLGWVEQSFLFDLLINTACVIIPQQKGFGVLTRISEFACAGIPILLSTHPSTSLDLPPNVKVLSENWGEWIDSINRILDGNTTRMFNLTEYNNWENQQKETLNSNFIKNLNDLF